jgi:hypothetical protein
VTDRTTDISSHYDTMSANRAERKLEDEINPPLSSTTVTDPAAVIEEIRGEDAEIAQMSHATAGSDLEKGAEKDVVESVSSDESTTPKIPVLDFPDGGFTAWLMVFGAWWISFSTFGMNSPIERKSLMDQVS